MELNQKKLLPQFLLQVSRLYEDFQALQEAEISTDSFSFYTSVASVYSSKIEGESIELDSFVKYKSMNVDFHPDYTQKIDDLYAAYLFAQKNSLNPQNIVKCHEILARNILSNNHLGKLRTQNMVVLTDDGRIEYVAASPFELEAVMSKFYSELTILLAQKLTIEEVFYYAANLHLVFVKIHPWVDGNGRSARLLEKWFLAHHLGKKAWFLQSEKNYYLQHQTYYQNLRKLGLEYSDLDFNQALAFLLMLPNSLNLSKKED